MLAGWISAELLIAGSLLLTGDSAPTLLPLIAVPVVTLSARFAQPGVWIGVGIAAALVVFVALATRASEVWANPLIILVPLIVVLTIALLSTALMHSDLEHRDLAVLDPLTGLLNRYSLERRAAELEQQSEVSREPVALIVADLDKLKAVNDTHGHAVGDAVLVEVADLIRRGLDRAFDGAYRIGGDEFLILMPGATLDAAKGLAERIRNCVESVIVACDCRASLSCGVSASGGGEPFDYELVFARADAALYQAKQNGRVVTSPTPVTTTVIAKGQRSESGLRGHDT